MSKMVKRTIEIDDDLDERISTIKEEILDDFIDYLEDNKETKCWDDYYQDRGADLMHEIVDSNTPIYYADIDALFYLYGSEFEEALKNAGVDTPTEDYKTIAIYYYLEEKGHAYLNELEDQFSSLIDEGKTIKEIIKVLKED